MLKVSVEGMSLSRRHSQLIQSSDTQLITSMQCLTVATMKTTLSLMMKMMAVHC